MAKRTGRNSIRLIKPFGVIIIIVAIKKITTMKTIQLFTVLTVASALIFTSCRKEEKELNDTESASNNEQSESISDDALNIADNAYRLGNNGYFRTDGSLEALDILATCATITNDTVSNPKVLIIDFGTVNCLCNDGRNRRGKIIVRYTGRYFDIGTSRIMTFDNYFRNDNKIEGERTVTTEPLDAQGHANWTINAVNMKITKADGKVHTWNSNRRRTMVAGQSTLIWQDDRYEITGTADGVNARGISYTAVITEPLYRSLSCRWIDQGKVEITPQGKRTRTIDFGDGSCDNQATISIGNRTRNITLH
jgi:hypothetical protein